METSIDAGSDHWVPDELRLARDCLENVPLILLYELSQSAPLRLLEGLVDGEDQHHHDGHGPFVTLLDELDIDGPLLIDTLGHEVVLDKLLDILPVEHLTWFDIKKWVNLSE